MTIMVVDRYTLPPGNCLVCYGSHLPAVSTGIDVHQPGQLQDAEVVICNKCVLHMAREVGKRIGYRVVADAFVDEMNNTISELEHRIVALNDERDKAYHARNALLASLGDTQWVPTPVEQAAVVLEAKMVATVLEAEVERSEQAAAAEHAKPFFGDKPPPKKRTR